MSLNGDITDFPLTEIVQIIGTSRRTGTLVLDGEAGKLSVSFHEGKPIHADSTDSRVKLGELLLKNNEINRRDVVDAILIQKRGSESGDAKRFGAILIEMGAVSPNVISKYVSNQIKESLYDILSERTGKFRFDPGEVAYDTDDFVSVDIEELILQGLRQIDEMARIKETFPSNETVYRRNEMIVERDAGLLHNDERLILSLIDGQRSLNDVYGLATFRRFDVIQIIDKLTDMDYIENVENTPPEIIH
ncbi:MAG: DUF4388 domain-containing protein [bacterium]|nr:DUF4388 domain-containing protein [bacterium]